MKRFLICVLLTGAVFFQAIQMNNNMRTKNIMRDNAKYYLTRFQMTHLMDHFNTLFQSLVIMMLLTPLALLSKSLRIAATFGAFAVIVTAVLLEFDQEDKINKKFWELIVVSMGLICV